MHTISYEVKMNSWLTQSYLTLNRFGYYDAFECTATQTNDTNYSCHIKAVELV